MDIFQADEQLRKDIDSKKKSLRKQIKEAKKVVDTINSSGWKDCIEPLIDKMIIDIVGGKIRGRYTGGLLTKAKKEELREYYIGYKQAMIDFYNRASDMAASYEVSQKLLEKAIEEEKRSEKLRYPLDEQS